MSETRKEYSRPVMEVLEFDHDNTVLTSGGSGRNPAQCTSKNPGQCNLGVNPGQGCSNTGNPGQGSYGGNNRNPARC